MGKAHHVLKTWPEPFACVWDGRKRAEFRKDDRGFEEGDVLELVEYDPDDGDYSGREIHVEVTDVRRGGPFGIPEGFAMLSFDRICMYHEGTLMWERGT